VLFVKAGNLDDQLHDTFPIHFIAGRQAYDIF
jgi:hypothetical protein